jgi:putative sigma-54 modulation protein
MQINITARHMEIDNELKGYINNKLEKLEKYNDKTENARVVFEKEKFNYITEITLTGKGFRIAAVEKNQDIRSSFDLCLSNAQSQLKKTREKVREIKVKRFFESFGLFKRKKRKLLSPAGSIVKTESFATKPMSPEEAALELDAFNKVFIVFRNSSNDKLNVLYKRKDSNYGLIEP